MYTTSGLGERDREPTPVPRSPDPESEERPGSILDGPHQDEEGPGDGQVGEKEEEEEEAVKTFDSFLWALPSSCLTKIKIVVLYRTV